MEGDHQNRDGPKGGGKNMALELNDRRLSTQSNGSSNMHMCVPELRGLESKETRHQSSKACQVP